MPLTSTGERLYPPGKVDVRVEYAGMNYSLFVLIPKESCVLFGRNWL